MRDRYVECRAEQDDRAECRSGEPARLDLAQCFRRDIGRTGNIVELAITARGAQTGPQTTSSVVLGNCQGPANHVPKGSTIRWYYYTEA